MSESSGLRELMDRMGAVAEAVGGHLSAAAAEVERLHRFALESSSNIPGMMSFRYRFGNDAHNLREAAAFYLAAGGEIARELPGRRFEAYDDRGATRVDFYAETDEGVMSCEVRLDDGELAAWVGGSLWDSLETRDDFRHAFARCYLDLDGFRDGDARPFDEVLAALEAE